ncbi:hypothetical protein ACOME3_003632 [Neoechinorhynchus agilis]
MLDSQSLRSLQNLRTLDLSKMTFISLSYESRCSLLSYTIRSPKVRVILPSHEGQCECHLIVMYHSRKRYLKRCKRTRCVFKHCPDADWYFNSKLKKLPRKRIDRPLVLDIADTQRYAAATSNWTIDEHETVEYRTTTATVTQPPSSPTPTTTTTTNEIVLTTTSSFLITASNIPPDYLFDVTTAFTTVSEVAINQSTNYSLALLEIEPMKPGRKSSHSSIILLSVISAFVFLYAIILINCVLKRIRKQYKPVSTVP